MPIVVEGFFSYLAQRFTSIRRCVMLSDLLPWPKSSRSFNHEFSKMLKYVTSFHVCSTIHTVLDGFFPFPSLNGYWRDMARTQAKCLQYVHIASGITLWLNYTYNGLCQGNHFMNQFCKFVRYICGLGYSKFCKHFYLNMMHCDSKEIVIWNYLHIIHIS